MGQLHMLVWGTLQDALSGGNKKISCRTVVHIKNISGRLSQNLITVFACMEEVGTQRLEMRRNMFLFFVKNLVDFYVIVILQYKKL